MGLFHLLCVRTMSCPPVLKDMLKAVVTVELLLSRPSLDGSSKGVFIIMLTQQPCCACCGMWAVSVMQLVVCTSSSNVPDWHDVNIFYFQCLYHFYSAVPYMGHVVLWSYSHSHTATGTCTTAPFGPVVETTLSHIDPCREWTLWPFNGNWTIPLWPCSGNQNIPLCLVIWSRLMSVLLKAN